MSDLILEIVEGTGAGKQIPLDNVVDVGRDPSLPLHLDEDTQVSRRHARFTAQGGGVAVEDLGSTNGTYVNEQPISSPRTLNPGDKVRIGLTVFELRTRQQVAARPSAVQVRPALTALSRDIPAYGLNTARVLLDMIDGKPPRSLQEATARLIVRGSTASAPLA